MYSNRVYLNKYEITEEELISSLSQAEQIYSDYCLRQSIKLKGREVKEETKLKLHQSINNRTPEESKEIGEKISSKMKGKPRGPRDQATIDKIKETKRKHPRIVSEYEIAYKSQIMKEKNTWSKGRKDSPETILKKKEMRKDTIYIINDNKEMKLWDKNEPIPSGWRRGWRFKNK